MPRSIPDWIPPDWDIPMLSEQGKLLLTHWEKDEVYHYGLRRYILRKPWFLKKRYWRQAVDLGLVIPPKFPWRSGRRKHRWKRHRSRFRVHTMTDRFRDSNPEIIPEKGMKGLVDTVWLDTITSGKVTATRAFHLTGDLSGSLYGKKCWDRLNPGPPYITGGPFSKVEFRIPSSQPWHIASTNNIGASGTNSQNYKLLRGTFYDTTDWGTDSLSNYLLGKPPELSGYDTVAWEKTKPHVSPGNLAQFLYELKDLPQMLETSANALWNSWRSFGGGYSSVVMHPKSVADNFVNHEFGWAPFIGDLQKLFDLYVHTERIIQDTIKWNGRWIRRKRSLESNDTTTLFKRTYGCQVTPSLGTFENQMCAPVVVDGISCNGLTDIHLRLTSDVWAVGSFKYYRPEFDDSLVNFSGQLMNIKRLMTIYGLRINPTIIWKLTPWTWAVDWFTRVGDFIQHHDEFVEDGIVSRYLYVMKSSQRYLTKTASYFFKGGTQTCNWQRNVSQKQRKIADSPYGFDRPWQNLSARQWAILGAIGITRRSDGFTSRG